MVKEARHAVEYRFPLIDLDTTEGVDAMSDERERVLMAVNRDDEEVRQLLTESDARDDAFEIRRVHLVREVARIRADCECGLKELQPPRRLVGRDRRDRKAHLRT